MIKLEFINKVNKIFKNYEFRIIKNKFFIEYGDVYVVVILNKHHSSYVFDYTFRVKAFHEINALPNNVYDDCELLALGQFIKRDGCYFDYEKLNEETLDRQLRNLIDKNILPFKEDAFRHIIKNVDSGYFILKKETKELLETYRKKANF